MKSFVVTDIKGFMAGLLTGDLFSEWQFRGAELAVECKISLSALAEHRYLTDHEEDYLMWPEIQEKLYGLIRGKRTPGYLRLALALKPSQVPEAARESIDAFTLNLQYENQTLLLVTAVSDKTFSLDKEPGRIWDAYLPDYLRKKGVELKELAD